MALFQIFDIAYQHQILRFDTKFRFILAKEHYHIEQNDGYN